VSGVVSGVASGPSQPREVHYRLRQGAAGSFPGAHRSPRGDTGQEFRAHVPLVNARDPRRLDIHASLRDPFGQWWVRVHAQRMAVPVVMIADLSSSMAFTGSQRRPEVLADVAQSLAWSASKAGDAFSFIGAHGHLPPAWLLPAASAAPASPWPSACAATPLTTKAAAAPKACAWPIAICAASVRWCFWCPTSIGRATCWPP